MAKILSHIGQSNQLKRADQVIALLKEICIVTPIRIDAKKITRSINSINLSWILAFCEMNYNSVADIDFKNLALSSLQQDTLRRLHSVLGVENLLKSKPKFFDEVDLVNGSTISKTLSYLIPAEIITSVILKNEMFKASVSKKRKPFKEQNLAYGIESSDYESRPSQTGIARSEVFRKALECIAFDLKLPRLNRDVLWKKLFEYAKKTDFLLKIKDRNTLQEGVTGNEWDRTKANRHLDAVIRWNNNLNAMA